jgi:hypothetical protein
MGSIDYTGTRFVLGRTPDGYAIWETAGGEPVEVFPITQEGWTAAWLHFRELEGSAPVARAGEAGGPIGAVRPFGLGGVLEGTFRVWGRNFLAFLIIVAAVMLPFAILQVIALQIMLGPELEALFSGQIPARELEVFRRIIEENLGPFVAAGLGLAVISLFVNAFLTAAVVRGGLQGFTGGRVRAAETMRASLRVTHSVAWVLFLTGLLVAAVGIPVVFLLVTLGSAAGSEPLTVLLGILAVLGLLLFATRYLFAASTSIAENLKGSAALRRSWHLTRGQTWPVFGTFLLLLLMVTVGTAIVTLPFQLIVGSQESLGAAWMVSALGSALASTLATPFTTLILVHLYIDARARKEELDPSALEPRSGVAP